jgi:uncharacterized membrane protein
VRTIVLIRIQFAVASASFAVLNLIYVDSAPLAQVLPAGIPWRDSGLRLFALLLLLASVGLCLPRASLRCVAVVAAYLAIWVAASTPQFLSNPLSFGAWYGFCEAMTSLVGACILGVMIRQQERGSEMSVTADRGVRVAQVLFGLTCVYYGLSHFLYADYTAGFLPNWLPGRLGFAYFTGACHTAAGIGIALGIFPRLVAALEATMMGSFGILVWVPSFFMQPRPRWAMPPPHQWSELVVTLLLTAAAWVVAASLQSIQHDRLRSVP